jgi:transcriptional regulator with XRE-family HTH domain
MLTELGKELRKLRIDHGERLVDMAQKIAKSASFISAVEIGKKAPPVGIEDQVARIYHLGDVAKRRLSRAADLSRNAFVVEAETPLARDTAGLFARKIKSLSSMQLEDIHKILNGEGEK